METKTNTKRVTITARDKIGREESITLILDKATTKRLEKAANNKTAYGMPDSYLIVELNDMLEQKYYYFSIGQTKRINKFFNLIYHKFYKCTLTIDSK